MPKDEGFKKTTQTDNDTLKSLGVYQENEDEITKEVKRAVSERIYSHRIS